MVRHPHFTQPVFVRFPRPAVMRGRDGAERFPQAADVGLEGGLVRALRRLDPSLTEQWAQQVVALHDERDVVRVKNAALRERPGDVRKFFDTRLRAHVPPTPVARHATPPVRTTPLDDPYGD
jgi:hypothetical protein